MLDSPFPQPHSLSSLVFSWSGTPYVSLPSYHLFATHAHAIASYFTVVPLFCHLFLIYLCQLPTWISVFYLYATHPSDHSHLCSLECHFIFMPYTPGLTSMQHTVSQYYMYSCLVLKLLLLYVMLYL